jgi:hypothetical protein
MATPTTGAGIDAGARMTAADPAGARSRIAASNETLRRSITDPSAPNYRGPGWEERGYGPDGGLIVGRSSDPAKVQAQNAWELQTGSSGAPVQPAIPTLDDLNAALAPRQAPAPLPVGQQVRTALGQLPAQPMANAIGVTPSALSGAQSNRSDVYARSAPVRAGVDLGQGTSALPGKPTSANPEAGGPAEVDRAKIDALLGNVSKANSGLMGLAQNDAQFSQAQAQLAIGTAQAQRNAISQARSGNRRDSAAMGARALQTVSELGSEATRSSALLRAQEEDSNRRLKLDAFKAAGDLGLNSAALEVDVNNLNMQAATSYLNNLFETNRLGMQLDEAEATRVTNFVRDMALVAKDYYALSMAERASVRDDLTRRYGIDEQTKLGLEQLDAQPGFWEQAALGLVGGAGQGVTGALTSFLLPGK